MRHVAVMALLGASLSACSTGYALVAPRPPVEYVSLGRTEAEYCGYWTQGQRYQRAYAEALAKVPTATRLVNVELQEGWKARFLFYRCATIRGEAIK